MESVRVPFMQKDFPIRPFSIFIKDQKEMSLEEPLGLYFMALFMGIHFGSTKLCAIKAGEQSS